MLIETPIIHKYASTLKLSILDSRTLLTTLSISMNFPGHYPSNATSPAPSQGPGHYKYSQSQGQYPLSLESIVYPLPRRAQGSVKNLIDMSAGSVHSDSEFDMADAPPSARTLVGTLDSPRAPFKTSPRHLLTETIQEERSVHAPSEPATPPPPTPPPPPPEYPHHPTYYYEDGTVFVLVEKCLFRLHRYHFDEDPGSIILEKLKETSPSEHYPLELPENIRISAFSCLLKILYRSPIDTSSIDIKTLRDACLTADALRQPSLCTSIANYIVATDIPDESLDQAVPKYVLTLKLPKLFPRDFREAQIDKLCCAVGNMTHSHMFEIGFMELPKIWKGALAARVGYDGVKLENYQPPNVPPRTSYLIKVKDAAGYRAVKQELFR